MRAFLIHEGTLYLAEGVGPFRHQTAVTRLIRGIWRTRPDRALSLLRCRIFTDAPLTPACEGMIKVAGKRYEVVSGAEWTTRVSDFGGPKIQLGEIPAEPGRHEFAPEPGNPIRTLTRLRDRAGGRPAVSALLVDPSGKSLLGAWSGTDEDKTAHAEVNLVQAWFDHHPAPVPRGSTLHVSLRPCAMCAGQILALAGEPGALRVVFHEEDPGPASKNSCLVPGSDLWFKAGSPDWQAIPAESAEFQEE